MGSADRANNCSPTYGRESVQQAIQLALQRLENADEVRVLYAVEPGSRAWGFASRNRSVCVRCCGLLMREVPPNIRIGADEALADGLGPSPLNSVLDRQMGEEAQ